MKFSVEFHGGFRVATGNAVDGVHDVVDPEDPLPGSELKGVMRAAARLLLPAAERDHPLIVEVFGTSGRPSPWNWGPAEPTGGSWQLPTLRASVEVDPGTGSAVPETLRLGQELWGPNATFEVTRIGRVADLHPHEVLLACAGQAVHALGSRRRRGLGWVTIRCVDFPVDSTVVDELIALRAPASVASGAGHV